MKERVCLMVFHFRVFVFVANSMCRFGMSARANEVLGLDCVQWN